jgi:DNA polymerase III subunit chi
LRGVSDRDTFKALGNVDVFSNHLVEEFRMSACMFHDSEPSLKDRRLFETVESAYSRREKVVVFAAGAERAAALDRVLWMNKQDSFIPHEIIEKPTSSPDIPVAIVISEFNPIDARILVADGNCSIEFAAGFETVHEFVDRTSPLRIAESRARFRAYRSLGFKVEYQK